MKFVVALYDGIGSYTWYEIQRTCKKLILTDFDLTMLNVSNAHNNNDFLKTVILFVDNQPDYTQRQHISQKCWFIFEMELFLFICTYLPKSIARNERSVLFVCRFVCVWLTWYYYTILMITKWGEPEIPFSVNYGKGNVMKIRTLGQRTLALLGYTHKLTNKECG